MLKNFVYLNLCILSYIWNIYSLIDMIARLYSDTGVFTVILSHLSGDGSFEHQTNIKTNGTENISNTTIKTTVKPV